MEDGRSSLHFANTEYSFLTALITSSEPNPPPLLLLFLIRFCCDVEKSSSSVVTAEPNEVTVLILFFDKCFDLILLLLLFPVRGSEMETHAEEVKEEEEHGGGEEDRKLASSGGEQERHVYRSKLSSTYKKIGTPCKIPIGHGAIYDFFSQDYVKIGDMIIRYQAANDCDLEPVAYEFFTLAFVLYEEEIALREVWALLVSQQYRPAKVLASSSASENSKSTKIAASLSYTKRDWLNVDVAKIECEACRAQIDFASCSANSFEAIESDLLLSVWILYLLVK
ncbi:hypothetical protein PIB30_001429 [Stylosanthes scabra]|uniref:Peptidase A1 domain-containing protein n=1 Tax=Stylosanthes scabra TaxID=79078 RepID=A0ABU6Z1K1_9FABA|nr:hypothetical protein [Stylosanthes scabra]